MFSEGVFTRGAIKSDKSDHFLETLLPAFLATFLTGLAAFLAGARLGAAFLAGAFLAALATFLGALLGAAFLATAALARANRKGIGEKMLEKFGRTVAQSLFPSHSHARC